MALGDIVQFKELHEFMQYAEVAGVWSGNSFSNPVDLDWFDMSKSHRLVCLLFFGDTSLIDPIHIALLQATDYEGADAKPLWVSAEIDGADVAGAVMLVDITLQSFMDGQNGFRYVAVDGMGQAPPVGWLLMGVGPRYKPPRYHEEATTWAELEPASDHSRLPEEEVL
jgi:hypothetical protein